MTSPIRTLLGCVLALALAAIAATASAAWPERMLKLVVPYAPGGITDIVARSVAARLSEQLGQPVVVDNRAGAGGTIGTRAVARAAPDGYTLLIGTSATHGTNPSTFRALAYRAEADFAPVALLATAPLMIVVHPALPVQTLPEFIDYLRANPGKVDYASTGSGGSVHLTTELFALRTGTSMSHVAYKGSAPALADLVSGHVQVMFDNVPSALPLVAAGKLRALAVTGAARMPLAPEVPSVAEFVPGFESLSWIALYAPAGTPGPIVQRLNDAVRRGLDDRRLVATFARAGLHRGGGTPQDLARHQRAEIARWADVVRAIGYAPP